VRWARKDCTAGYSLVSSSTTPPVDDEHVEEVSNEREGERDIYIYKRERERQRDPVRQREKERGSNEMTEESSHMREIVYTRNSKADIEREREFKCELTEKKNIEEAIGVKSLLRLVCRQMSRDHTSTSRRTYSRS
jgi:hypothetical protein